MVRYDADRYKANQTGAPKGVKVDRNPDYRACNGDPRFHGAIGQEPIAAVHSPVGWLVRPKSAARWSHQRASRPTTTFPAKRSGNPVERRFFASPQSQRGNPRQA